MAEQGIGVDDKTNVGEEMQGILVARSASEQAVEPDVKPDEARIATEKRGLGVHRQYKAATRAQAAKLHEIAQKVNPKKHDIAGFVDALKAAITGTQTYAQQVILDDPFGKVSALKEAKQAFNEPGEINLESPINKLVVAVDVALKAAAYTQELQSSR